MKKTILSLLACGLLLSLSACENVQKEDVGLVAGGAAGAGIGYAITGSPLGAAAGAVGGALIGKKVTEDK